MPDMVMMGYRTQALSFPVHHPHHFFFLVRCQLGLRPELDTPFLGLRPATIGSL
jgi:hypothetical protein